MAVVVRCVMLPSSARFVINFMFVLLDTFLFFVNVRRLLDAHGDGSVLVGRKCGVDL